MTEIKHNIVKNVRHLFKLKKKIKQSKKQKKYKICCTQHNWIFGFIPIYYPLVLTFYTSKISPLCLLLAMFLAVFYQFFYILFFWLSCHCLALVSQPNTCILKFLTQIKQLAAGH